MCTVLMLKSFAFDEFQSEHPVNVSGPESQMFSIKALLEQIILSRFIKFQICILSHLVKFVAITQIQIVRLYCAHQVKQMLRN